MIDPKHPASASQIHAATPGNSSWVSANAGSGKTRVLTDRVARLLLNGTQPARILCLTYTKAAAAEMQTRLFKRLGEWAMMPKDDLRRELHQLGEAGEAIEDAQLNHARTLFARALETPGGLKIQTIHSFCEQMLRRFPLETGVAPQFEVMEDRQAAQLRAAILDELALDPNSGFAALVPYLPGQDPAPVLDAILRYRPHFAKQPEDTALRQALGATGPGDEKTLVLNALAPIPGHLLSQAMDAMDRLGKATDAKTCAALRAALAHPETALVPLRAAFLTNDMTVRKALITKAVKDTVPEAEAQLADLGEAVLAAVNRQHAEAAFQAAQALGRFGHAFLDRYAARKTALGKLDFDDLIDRAKRLLSETEATAWVQYRMDGGIDHILVDEAQDTSLDQWAVIDALAAEFFTGQGARDLTRTLFVVGDEKQSIYSFQGADPTAFGDKRRHYSAALDAATIGLEQCDLLYSFRTARPILQLVDQVFAENPVHGLGDDIAHRVFHTDKPGRVDLWSFIEKPDKPAPDPWHLPVDQPPRDDPALVLARQVAAHIADILNRSQILPGTDKRISAGDFLILVQGRGALFHAIIRELKKADVPVAGADRLKVGGELAVRDLLAVLRFLATEDDNLSLAAALRSPIFGISEAELYALAHPRESSLWHALSHATARAGPVAILRDLRNQADFLRPFDLLERLLTTHDRWQAITARLGTEAEDGIEALLDLALSYERVETPTLTGFLQWMDSEDVEIKRQLDEAQDQVRVMTVHGAKGLEAPIVILPETHQKRDAKAPPLLLVDDLPLMRMPKDAMPAALGAADSKRRQLELEERWRLLYVALTRAENWLIVAGGGEKGSPEKGWYAAVETAMDTLGAQPTETGLTLCHNWTEATDDKRPEPPRPPESPTWLTQRAPTPKAPPQAIAPSRDGGTHHALPGANGDDTDIALARGRDLHKMLEALSGHAAQDRPSLAETLFPDMPEATCQDLCAEATRVLDAPHLSWVFNADAMTEVPVRGLVSQLGPRPLRGQIDRLIVGPDDIWAIDFKSNRTVPQDPNDIPDGLIGQMALYHAALSDIWPDRSIRTGLIWTAEIRFMEIEQKIVNTWLETHWSG
ncbi:double-strand break repair helicase AddA [Halovulum sp. GXIMD14793]